jgi:hypothetical protein
MHAPLTGEKRDGWSRRETVSGLHVRMLGEGAVVSACRHSISSRFSYVPFFSKRREIISELIPEPQGFPEGCDGRKACGTICFFALQPGITDQQEKESILSTSFR